MAFVPLCDVDSQTVIGSNSKMDAPEALPSAQTHPDATGNQGNQAPEAPGTPECYRNDQEDYMQRIA